MNKLSKLILVVLFFLSINQKAHAEIGLAYDVLKLTVQFSEIQTHIAVMTGGYEGTIVRASQCPGIPGAPCRSKILGKLTPMELNRITNSIRLAEDEPLVKFLDKRKCSSREVRTYTTGPSRLNLGRLPIPCGNGVKRIGPNSDSLRNMLDQYKDQLRFN